MDAKPKVCGFDHLLNIYLGIVMYTVQNTAHLKL